MVAQHAGGETVRGGIYWSMKAGEFVAVPKEGGKLEGGPESKYVKAPLPIVLILGPIMGLAFALFLPLSGLLVLVPFLVGKLRGAVVSGKVTAAHAASPRMQPGVSYLQHRSGDDPAGEPGSGPATEKDDRLVDLAEKIAEKRWQKK